MNIAMICRYDNSGLGTMSWEFAQHLKPKKILLKANGVFQTFPERYSEFDTRTEHENYKDWLTEDIDILLSIETFYDWSLIPLARTKGVKTVLIPMIEMSPERFNYFPDWFLCPSKLDYEYFKGHSAQYLPVPLNTEKLKWKKREKASVFIHNGSHGGQNNRKGTHLLLAAMSYVRSDIKLIVNSWSNYEFKDERVEIRTRNFKNYWQCWEEGDVLVYPQDYNGICLPIVEAMASGLGVITTDIYPFNEYMPKDLLFEPESMYKTRAIPNHVEMDAAKIEPRTIAKKIDEIAGTDISEYSEYGRQYAIEHSWEKLLPKYNEFFEKVQAS